MRNPLIATALSLAVCAAWAAPAADSPLYTDPQESHVFDQTSERIGTTDMIACIIGAMAPAQMVNQGDYVALIDQLRCDAQKNTSASNSAGSSAQSNFITAIVNSSRSDNASPMRARAWLDDPSGEGTGKIWVNLLASEAPSDGNPYGVFRLDYCGEGETAGTCAFQGFLAGSATGLQFAERESQGADGGTTQLFLSKTPGVDAGKGAIEFHQSYGGNTFDGAFQFGFDAQRFRRKSGVQEACFDRRLAEARKSVWRYGLYDDTGARVELQSGFPIQYTAGGTTFYGYASYHGLSLPQVAAQALATGDTVRRPAEAGQPAALYTVRKAGGRLIKYTLQTTTAAEFTGNRFTFGAWNGLTESTRTAVDPQATEESIRRSQLQAHIAPDGGVIVDGVQVCGDEGCVTRDLAPVELSAGDLALYPNGLQGWSQAYGAELSVPAATIARLAQGDLGGTVSYRSQGIVNPGDGTVPTTLYCAANCPTDASIQAYSPAVPDSTPYANADTWGGTESLVTYTYNAGTGELESGGLPAVWNGTPAMPGRFGHGLRSGNLVGAAALLECEWQPPQGPTRYCNHAASAEQVYYAWETGPNAWNQNVALLDAQNVAVVFDPPLLVEYAVPADAAEFGEYAGRTIPLQYGGFGQLWGIPGHCVDPADNTEVSCDAGQNVRWVPQFVIPWDPANPSTVSSGAATYYVKWLDREVRFRKLPAADCAAVELGETSDLPALTGLRDPSDPAQTEVYLGPIPDLGTPLPAPRVIDGVVQD